MLTEKTIIVTGGAGVLGLEVAKAAKSYGAQVVLFDVVEGFEHEVGKYMRVDLTDQAALKVAVDAVVKDIGEINGVANIAGGFDMGPTVYETEDQLWEAMFTINVTTLRRVLSTVTPNLVASGSGSIVNIGALGAMRGAGNMGAYTAAKSTVMRLTESLSDEVKSHGVNVNAVLPSLIDTPRNRADMPDADYSSWVKPSDIAEVVCFLLSARAKAIHGALVPVNGLM